MAKTLLFDFGCILVGLDKQRCINALEKVGCGRIAYYVDECRQEDLFHELEVGGSIEAFCEEARRQSSYTDEAGVERPCRASDEDICWAWNELVTDIPVEKLRMIKHLHDDLGYRTAILSNTNQIHWQKAVRDLFTADGLAVEDYFDEIFLSCDLGMVKPDACIYEEVRRRLAGDILFIDDSAKNCAAAEAMGIATLHDPKGDLWLTELPKRLAAGCGGKATKGYKGMTKEGKNMTKEGKNTTKKWKNTPKEGKAAGKAAIIGNFDGVHLGHRFMAGILREEARKRGLATVAITFDRHPRAVFDPSFVGTYLTSADEKAQLLKAAGIDEVRVMPFTKALADIPARTFMERVLRDEMGVKLLLLGYDNRFGRRTDNAEGYEQYVEYGREAGIEVMQATPAPLPRPVSSSVVRRLLKEGRMEEATECLGRPYALSGKVVEGHHEGRKIGFPTANIAVPKDRLLPAKGVYASRVILHGDCFPAITNIGTRPTYEGEELTIETHIPAFEGDLYGEALTVELLRRLREERRFATPEELREQIAQDILATKEP